MSEPYWEVRLRVVDRELKRKHRKSRILNIEVSFPEWSRPEMIRAILGQLAELNQLKEGK